MKVLLVSANTEMINMPVMPLGMSCVAEAAAAAGHEVRQINLLAKQDAIQELVKSIQSFDPDVIGMSVRNIDDQVSAGSRFLLEPVKAMVDACRSNATAVTVLGGAGYSIFPQDALEYLDADMGIQGEGERSFVMLLESLEHGRDLSKIPGLYHRRLGIQNPNTAVRDIDNLKLPDPDTQIWSIADAADQSIWLPIQTRRGCPLNCSYCSTPTIEGRIIRKRKIDSILAAMKSYAFAGFERYFFVDNTFNIPSGYAKDLCGAISASGLKIEWRGILHPWKVDEELVDRMAGSGCTDISLGFESGSDLILKKMNKRFTIKDVRTISGLLKSRGIRVMGFLMLGSPGETRRTVLDSLEFVDSLQLDAVKISVGLRIYPYTVLAEHARKVGMISKDDPLLLPQFFIEGGLEDWIRLTIAEFVKDRPNWIC
jgi:radical SAM superfamily enzyme YgiQ (UPF0313 family)